MGKGEGWLLQPSWLGSSPPLPKVKIDLTTNLDVTGGVLVSPWIWQVGDNYVSIAPKSLEDHSRDPTSY